MEKACCDFGCCCISNFLYKIKNSCKEEWFHYKHCIYFFLFFCKSFPCTVVSDLATVLDHYTFILIHKRGYVSYTASHTMETYTTFTQVIFVCSFRCKSWIKLANVLKIINLESIAVHKYHCCLECSYGFQKIRIQEPNWEC